MNNLAFRALLLVTVAVWTGIAFAQPSPSQSKRQGTSGVGAASSPALQNMPEGCRQAAQSNPQARNIMSSPMMRGNMPNVPGVNRLSEASQDYMDTMRRMTPAMMMGMVIDDPELAFLCSMIGHHQGAIDMAEVALKYSKDPDVRQHAEKLVSDQKHDIEQLTALVNKHTASKDGPQGK